MRHLNIRQAGDSDALLARIRTLIVPDGALTDNGDGSATLRAGADRLSVAQGAPDVYPDPTIGVVRDYLQIFDTITTFPRNAAQDFGQVAGIRSYLDIAAVNTPNSFDAITAGVFQLNVTDTNQIDLYSVVGVQGKVIQYGAHAIASMEGLNFSTYQYGSGAVAVMHGIYAEATNYSAGAGSVTEAAILYLERDFADGPITTKYGLYIGSQENVHITHPWSIWTNGGGHHLGGFVDLIEIAAPDAPAANIGRLFVRDSGGKSQLAIRFPSGAVQVIATEP